MRGWPLRLKVTLWVVFVGAFALMLFGGVIGVTLRRTKLASIDEALTAQAGGFFESLDARKAPVDWSSEAEVRAVFSAVHSLFAAEIEDPPGRIVYRSRNLGTAHIPETPEGRPATVSIGHRQARVIQSRSRGVVLRIAADLGPTLEMERKVFMVFITMFPVTILVMAVGGSWLSRKALRQVDEIAAAADRVGARKLDEHLPSPGTDDEIGRLTRVLNAMLDRIREGFEQTRRFTADASHELKTPLTIIRGEVEAALRSGELTPAVEKTMVNLHEETGRLIYLVEGLLLLSQADAGKLELASVTFDFSQLVSEIAEDAEILAAPREIRLETKIEPSIKIHGEPHFLRQLVLNLFDNAVKYNVHRGRVQASLVSMNGSVIFTISNTGPGVPRGEHEHIFRRFHRADKSRDRRTGGQGLGLSISLEIARAHGGEIVLVDSDPGLTTFKFTLPLNHRAHDAE